MVKKQLMFKVLNICGGSSLRSDEHKLKIFNAVDVAPVIWTPRMVGFHLLSYVQIRGCLLLRRYRPENKQKLYPSRWFCIPDMIDGSLASFINYLSPFTSCVFSSKSANGGCEDNSFHSIGFGARCEKVQRSFNRRVDDITLNIIFFKFAKNEETKSKPTFSCT